MKFPRMSPRRWFWLLTAAVALWLVGSMKWGETNGSASTSGSVIATVLALPAAPLSWLQNRFERFARDTGEAPAPYGDPAALEARNRKLEAEAITLASRIAVLEQRLKDYRLYGDIGWISNAKMVPATVFGWGASAASDVCQIDKGQLDGVQLRAPLVSGLAPLGRVIAVSAKTSTVRLITDTDRSMQISAQLVRPRGDRSYVVIADRDKVQVRGLGGGLLGCDTIPTVGVQMPLAGDLLLVSDADWRLLEGCILGRVLSVTRSEKQPLRYDLRIEPWVRPSQMMHVWVVVP